MNVCGGWAYIDEPREKLQAILDDLEEKRKGRNFYTDNGRFAEAVNHFRLYDSRRKYYEDNPWSIIWILREYLSKGIAPDGWM